MQTLADEIGERAFELAILTEELKRRPRLRKRPPPTGRGPFTPAERAEIIERYLADPGPPGPEEFINSGRISEAVRGKRS